MNVATELPSSPLPSPLRVVLFCGPVLQRGTVRFARLLARHPDVEFAGGVCQSPGFGWRPRLRDLVRRRGLLAAPLAAWGLAGGAYQWLVRPRIEWRCRQDAAWLVERLHVVPDIHHPVVLDEVRALAPDLGLVYGGPILKLPLFTIPRFGTLGIHHGRLPDYRGKKATFWAMYNGEAVAGVTIQQLNAGIDTGSVVRCGEVPIRGRSYRQLVAELEEIGLELYMDAVLDVKRGAARATPLSAPFGPLYRDPSPGHLLRFAWNRLVRASESRELRQHHPK